MNKYDLAVYRQFKVTFVPWTETRGESLRITETRRSHNQRTKSILFSIDYEQNDIQDQAINILKRNGFKPVCRTYEKDCSIILCDAFGDGFKEVTTLI